MNILLFDDWVYMNNTELEILYLQSIPADEQPLDDDIPDFFDEHAEEFRLFCHNEYERLLYENNT